jgi:hypothetical protein
LRLWRTAAGVAWGGVTSAVVGCAHQAAALAYDGQHFPVDSARAVRIAEWAVLGNAGSANRPSVRIAAFTAELTEFVLRVERVEGNDPTPITVRVARDRPRVRLEYPDGGVEIIAPVPPLPSR